MMQSQAAVAAATDDLVMRKYLMDRRCDFGVALQHSCELMGGVGEIRQNEQVSTFFLKVLLQNLDSCQNQAVIVKSISDYLEYYLLLHLQVKECKCRHSPF